MRVRAGEAPLKAASGWLRPAIGLGILTASVLLLKDRFAGTEPADILGLIQAITPAQWIAAILLTAASFAAVGVYDVAVHRWLSTGVAPRRAGTSGAAAIAVSQIVGMGLVTGTLARWHLLPEVTLERAARITAAVGVSFLAALAAVLGLIGLLIGLPEAVPSWLVPLGLAAGAGAVALSILQPARLPFQMPSLRLTASIFAATAADTILAALALWVLLPESAAIPAHVLVPAFMIALGAGLMSGTPAAAGPFELTLLWLLPMAPEADLLAAILAFRLVYYGLPAILGGAVMLASAGATRADAEDEARADARSLTPDRAETAGLVRSGDFTYLLCGQTWFATAATGQSLVALGDPSPVTEDPPSALRGLEHAALSRGLWPALYKCGARTAVAARGLGWSVFHVADEMVVDTDRFTTDGSAAARLRRKLRTAERAGLVVEEAHVAALPVSAMDRIAREWAAAHDGERGFSMGRWSPDHVAGQRVFLARQNGDVAAFVSFHDNGREWVLDLVRTGRSAPDGTMHALVTAAIRAAAAGGVTRVSLAALPSERLCRLAARLTRRPPPGDGLRQFKSAFRPRREPLYLSAPGVLSLVVAAVGIRRRITRPGALPASGPAPVRRHAHAGASRSS